MKGSVVGMHLYEKNYKYNNAIMGASCALTPLLLLTVITLTSGQTQYFDVLQGLQQLFQPFQENDNIKPYNGATRAPPHKQTTRQEIKKKTIENRNHNEERRTKKRPPTNQYDYVFATTEKTNRKTTKSINSSQNSNSRSFNNEYEYGNKFNVARPVTENVFENVNNRDTFAVNNQPRPANLLSNGDSFPSDTNNRPQNDDSNVNNINRRTQNTDYNINFPSITERNRNNNAFFNTDIDPGFNSFGNAGVDFNNRGTTNNNRGNSNFNTNNNRGNNNNFNQGNNFGGFYYPDNPIINRPGVLPSSVDVNLPPITNRPATNINDFGGFNRPSQPTSVTFTDPPDQEPEILIGPDEDDMTEWQKRSYAEKAERMCDYYKSLTVKKVVALPLLPSPDPVEIKVSDCVPINVPLIIGGAVATIREFPHMALVGWRNIGDTGYSWKCGGSLVSDRYVLTAGHCTYASDANGPPEAVQLGSSNRDDRGALVVKISAVIRHPKYKRTRSYHDIALIKLVSKVKFSEVIRPACLGVPPPNGRSIIATGWGKTEFNENSVQLRSVSLKVWDIQECMDIWGTTRKLPNGVSTDSHMCAGDRGGGHDTCQGDSGGPAQIQDGCLWRVVAVTSVGMSCAAPNTPALYAVIPHAFVSAQVFDETS